MTPDETTDQTSTTLGLVSPVPMCVRPTGERIPCDNQSLYVCADAVYECVTAAPQAAVGVPPTLPRTGLDVHQGLTLGAGMLALGVGVVMAVLTRHRTSR